MRNPLTKTELIEAPATQPVTVEELLSQHLWNVYPEHQSEGLLGRLIKSATNHVETVIWRKLVSQRWRLYLDAWPADGIYLPFGRVLSVDDVFWLDEDGVDYQLVSGGDYIPAVIGEEPMVLPVSSGWPSGVLFDVNSIRVEFTAGYGAAADVPEDIRHAIMMLAGHWYETREAVILGTTVRKVPLGFSDLIRPYKVRYL